MPGVFSLRLFYEIDIYEKSGFYPLKSGADQKSGFYPLPIDTRMVEFFPTWILINQMVVPTVSGAE